MPAARSLAVAGISSLPAFASIFVSNHTPAPRSGVLSCEVLDDMVVYSPHTSGAASLNESARAIWLLWDGKRTMEQIWDEFAIQFDATPEQMRRDVAARLNRFTNWVCYATCLADAMAASIPKCACHLSEPVYVSFASHHVALTSESEQVIQHLRDRLGSMLTPRADEARIASYTVRRAGRQLVVRDAHLSEHGTFRSVRETAHALDDLTYLSHIRGGGL